MTALLTSVLTGIGGMAVGKKIFGKKKAEGPAKPLDRAATEDEVDAAKKKRLQQKRQTSSAEGTIAGRQTFGG